MGTKHFPEDPKSPEHKTSNIEEQISVESKEPGEIGEDGNEVVDLQGKPAVYKHACIDVILKYIESIYKEEMKGLSRYIPFESQKRKKSKDTSTLDKCIFKIDLLVLTRWAFLYFFLSAEFEY